MALVTQLSVIALPGSPPQFGVITQINESGQVNIGMQVSVTDIQPNYNESGTVNIGMEAGGGESFKGTIPAKAVRSKLRGKGA